MKARYSLLCGTVAMAACGLAQAMEVEVHGIVDSYLQVYSKGGETSVSQGCGGKAGSRYGFKGSEQIKNGNTVFFRLENGFMTDDGTNSSSGNSSAKSGRAFQRKAVLGVKGDWGTLSAGRQYTLNFGNTAQFDAFSVGLGSTINNFVRFL